MHGHCWMNLHPRQDDTNLVQLLLCFRLLIEDGERSAAALLSTRLRWTTPLVQTAFNLSNL